MPPPNDQQAQTPVTNPTPSQPQGFDFSNIEGHIEHGTVPSQDPMVRSAVLGPNYMQDAADAWNSVREEMRNHQGDHPVLGSIADKMDALQEMLFGGQSVGKPMGTKGGVADEAQALTTAADAPEMTEAAVQAASKGLSHLAETGGEFIQGLKEEVPQWMAAKAPATGEAGAVRPFNFDEIPGHETIKPVEPPKPDVVPPPPSPNAQSAESAQRYNASRGMKPIDHSADELPPAEERAAFADAYDAANHEPENPAVQGAYNAMKRETLEQFEHAKNDLGIKFDFTDKDPYKNAEEMMADVRNNHHLSVYTGGELPKDHPLAEVEPNTGQSYNNLFRATHDIFGHTAGGHDFTENGEYNAFKAHNQMYSDEAKPAVRTETLGQSNWVSNNKDVREGRSPQYSQFAEQKATILPEAPKTEAEPVDEGTVRDSVDAAGGVYRGINKGAQGERVVEITLPREMTDKLPIQDRMKDFVSVSMPADDVNEQSVRDAMDKKFIQFGGKQEDLQPKFSPEKERNTKSELDQLKEVYPTTTDPNAALQGGTFITPEGEYMPLGAGDEHFKAIEKVRPPEAGQLRNVQVMKSREQLPNFLEQNNLVRTRFLQGRAGSDLHISVPENITPEQLQSIKQAVGKNRNGNLIIELTTGGLDSSRVIPFATPADVDSSLHELGVHPESWSKKAVQLMGQSDAGGIDPRTGKIDETGYGVEVFPEARAAREPLDHQPTRQEIEDFYKEHKEIFDKHPELRVGWDKTDKGWELNIGAVGKNPAGAELVGRNLDQRAAYDITAGREIPTGGKGEKTKFGKYSLEKRLDDLSGKNVSKLPPTIKNSPHLTDPEKYLLASDSSALKGFKATRKKIASARELAETAKAGEANRFWYDRANAAFNSMFDVLPKGSYPADDREKFIKLVAATSPRIDVTENLASALNAYRAWVTEGRPTDPMQVRDTVDSSLMMPGAHGPNAVRALTGQELSGPKVTSFYKNFMGSASHVTNDMWGAVTNGIMDAKELSNPGSYIALSENYRKAAESLGWTPQQAQAASWGFVRTLGNVSGYGGKTAGGDKPAGEIAKMIDDPTVRKYSADIADIFLTSQKVRDRLEALGINLEDFDARLKKSIEPYGRGGEGKTRGTNPKHLAGTARKVEEAKQFNRAQAAAGRSVNEKALPLLEGVMKLKKK